MIGFIFDDKYQFNTRLTVPPQKLKQTKIDDGMLLQLTSMGDKISARELYKNPGPSVESFLKPIENKPTTPTTIENKPTTPTTIENKPKLKKKYRHRKRIIINKINVF